MKSIFIAAAVAMAAAGAFTPVNASDQKTWTVERENSQVAFGSVKKGKIGEVHTFSDVTGSIDAEGTVNIEIATASLETNIPIRNKRMLKWVFDAAFPKIELTAKLDMKAISALSPGATTTIDIEGKITLNGKSVDVDSEMFVARLADNKVLATTSSMIIVSMDDLGVDAGITKLMEVAKLPSIARASPVTVRLVFKANKKQASNTSQTKTKVVASATASVTGDPKLGKKVFKRCIACHQVKKAKNKVGPPPRWDRRAKASRSRKLQIFKSAKDVGRHLDKRNTCRLSEESKGICTGNKNGVWRAQG